jgi:hypothetical protein
MKDIFVVDVGLPVAYTEAATPTTADEASGEAGLTGLGSGCIGIGYNLPSLLVSSGSKLSYMTPLVGRVGLEDEGSASKECKEWSYSYICIYGGCMVELCTSMMTAQQGPLDLFASLVIGDEEAGRTVAVCHPGSFVICSMHGAVWFGNGG